MRRCQWQCRALGGDLVLAEEQALVTFPSQRDETPMHLLKSTVIIVRWVGKILSISHAISRITKGTNVLIFQPCPRCPFAQQRTFGLPATVGDVALSQDTSCVFKSILWFT